MRAHIRPALVSLVLLSVVTGLAYPALVTVVAQLIFPRQANGSLIVKDGKVIGSELIGQNFTSEKYFHGRPSATPGPDTATARRSSRTDICRHSRLRFMRNRDSHTSKTTST